MIKSWFIERIYAFVLSSRYVTHACVIWLVGRVFSVCSRVGSKIRSRMSPEMLSALCIPQYCEAKLSDTDK